MTTSVKWLEHVIRPDQDYVGRQTLWMVPPERNEEDTRSRDGWTEPTETRVIWGRPNMRSMTELAGEELCLPQGPGVTV